MQKNKLNMKKIFTLLLALSAYFTSNAQYKYLFVEGRAGLNGVVQPSMSSFKLMNFGIGYMFNPSFGLKLDYASDSFRLKTPVETPIEFGTDGKRISLQGVLNVSAVINDREAEFSKFNFLIHAGAGYSVINSTLIDGNDQVLNIIAGLTPKFKVTKSLALIVDTSIILNESQHFNFDGSTAITGNVNNSFTGIMYNVSGGLMYSFDMD